MSCSKRLMLACIACSLLLSQALPLGAQSLPLLGVGGAVVGGSFTLVQSRIAACGTASTCAITLASSVVAHNTLVYVMGFANGDEQFLSADKGGTLVPVQMTQGWTATDGLNSAPMAYVLDASAATSPITVTLLHSQNTWIRLYELSHTGSAPAFDAANNKVSPSGNPTGPTLTLSGAASSDFIVQSAAPATSVTAAASPYNTHFENDTDDDGYSWITGAANGNGAAWTLGSSGITRVASLALGFGTSSCVNRTLVTFDGTNNTAVTAASLLSTTHGFTGGVWQLNGTALKYQTAASTPSLTSTGRICNGETVASGTGTTGLAYLTATNASYVRYSFGQPISDIVSFGVFMTTDLADADSSNFDPFGGGGTTEFCNAKFLGGGATREFQLETDLNSYGTINVNTATTYWVECTIDNTANVDTLKVYSADHSTLIGSQSGATAGTQKTVHVDLGNSNGNTPTTGHHIYFDSLKIDFDGNEATP